MKNLGKYLNSSSSTYIVICGKFQFYAEAKIVSKYRYLLLEEVKMI
jgi:hypothetical protein